MRSRLTTVLLVAGLVVFGAGGAYTASAHLGLAQKAHGKGKHGKKHAKRHGKHRARGHHKNNRTATQPTTTQPTTTSEGTSSAQTQYGTRPGKGCGDRNHVHTGPPGNPSNTSCPPKSQHTATSAPSKSATPKSKHHSRKHHKRHGKRKARGHHKG